MKVTPDTYGHLRQRQASLPKSSCQPGQIWDPVTDAHHKARAKPPSIGPEKTPLRADRDRARLHPAIPYGHAHGTPAQATHQLIQA